MTYPRYFRSSMTFFKKLLVFVLGLLAGLVVVVILSSFASLRTVSSGLLSSSASRRRWRCGLCGTPVCPRNDDDASSEPQLTRQRFANHKHSRTFDAAMIAIDSSFSLYPAALWRNLGTKQRNREEKKDVQKRFFSRKICPLLFSSP